MGGEGGRGESEEEAKAIKVHSGSDVRSLRIIPPLFHNLVCYLVWVRFALYSFHTFIIIINN